MWDYLKFFIHLKNKPKDEYTDVEEYVYNQLHEGKFDYFPIGRSICIPEIKEDER